MRVKIIFYIVIMTTIHREPWGLVVDGKTDIVSLWLNDGRIFVQCKGTGQKSNMNGVRFTLVDTLLMAQWRRNDTWDSVYIFKLTPQMAYDVWISFVHINVQKKPTWKP